MKVLLERAVHRLASFGKSLAKEYGEDKSGDDGNKVRIAAATTIAAAMTTQEREMHGSLYQAPRRKRGVLAFFSYFLGKGG